MHKRFTIEEYVRWSDTDCTGMIYYGQFLRLCEIAETELFRAVGLPYSAVFDRLDIWLPRVQIHFDFHKPLVFDDLIEVSAYVGRFGSKSLTLQFEVTKKGETDLVAGGRIVLACVNPRHSSPWSFPARYSKTLDLISPNNISLSNWVILENCNVAKLASTQCLSVHSSLQEPRT
jgi:acyl-CoA thioester hydrolase